MIYAIGDIHGQKTMLDHALALIETDGGPDAQIVFLGDYTDRGPDSKGVIETLIAGQSAGRNWHFIKGNHDKFFIDFVTQGIQHAAAVKSGISWINPRLGGVTTLASYGVTGTPVLSRAAPDALEYLDHYDTGATPKDIQDAAQRLVPQSHLDFLAHLPLTYETDDLLFVHAGIRPGIPLTDQVENDLIWIREGWLEDRRDHGKLVVHGHTALDTPQNYGNRVNLDGGAGYGRPLVPAVFEGRNCWTLTDTGRIPLCP
jgi:serine/threonine protein phosphatase 1